MPASGVGLLTRTPRGPGVLIFAFVVLLLFGNPFGRVV